MKLVTEYRRRALSVTTLASSVESQEEAGELRKIARLYERLATLREKRVQVKRGQAEQ